MESALKPVMQPHGFSLIELLVTVAIIGLLAAVALPSYRAHIQRGRIAQATQLLASTSVALETYYQDHRNFGTAGGACGVTPGAATSDPFDYTCALQNSDQGYLLSATGKGNMAGFTFTLDQQNVRQTTQFNGTASSLACWISHAGDTC